MMTTVAKSRATAKLSLDPTTSLYLTVVSRLSPTPPILKDSKPKSVMRERPLTLNMCQPPLHTDLNTNQSTNLVLKNKNNTFPMVYEPEYKAGCKYE